MGINSTGDGIRSGTTSTFSLEPTAEQKELVSALSSLLQRHCGMDVVRNAAQSSSGCNDRLWDELFRFGIVDIALSGSDGGGLLDLALCCEVLGSAIAPAPVAEAAAAVRLLDRLPGPMSSRLLQEAISGRSLPTLAVRPPVNGVLRGVPAGAVAESVLFVDGAALFVVTGKPPVQLPNLGDLSLSDRDTRGAVELSRAGEADSGFKLATAELAVLNSAYLIGAAVRCLEIGLAYTTERKAFGVPVASFQSVAHRFADNATKLEGARLLTREAAWAFDAGRSDRHRLAAMAVVLASEIAEEMATDVLHFHGGYGYMLEYDISVYFRRIKGLILCNGDTQDQLHVLADLLWPPVSLA